MNYSAVLEEHRKQCEMEGKYVEAEMAKNRIEELKNLLAPKGIRVLSKKWLTSDAKYSLECLVCGNKWRAQGNMFFNSRRVAGCRVCALKEVAGANRGELQDLKDFANGFGGECHLDAPMVNRALAGLDLPALDLVIVENVGNLVCPAEFDVGEHARAMVYSPTEGEEKPLKYPVMFRTAEVVVVNKIDLLPHVRFDVARCKEFARRVNPGIQILELSATTGEGMGAWLDWLLAAPAQASAPSTDDSVTTRIAALEAELARLRALPA
jgi:hydrogenase accessory protein HypB